VLLTAREHYLCHKLLTYIYPKNDKIVDAFFRMTFSKVNGYVVSSRDHKLARELMNTTPKTEETKKKIKDNHSHYWKGKHFSEEVKKAWSEQRKGQTFSDQACKNMSEARKGIQFSKEHCENIRLSKLGANNPNFGKRNRKYKKRNEI
jgi:hypothetical protein